MPSLHKINPMVRAVGTMGAVVALVGAVTFAQLQSNTVKLTSNKISTETSSLKIGTGPSNSCTGNATSLPGMELTGLTPGVASDAFNFCLTNAGDNDLSVTVSSPTSFTHSTIPAADVTLNFTCGSTGPTAIKLSELSSPTMVDESLVSTHTDQCHVTATLKSDYTGPTGSVTPFELDFAGTAVES